MEKTDITIIGAGVVGLSIAAEISRPDLKIFILEKNHTYGEGISSRNSEVIHAGIYYPRNSLKASLCLEGNGLLYAMAEKNGIPYQKTGKLIVAASDREVIDLEKIYSNGRENGVNLQMINKRHLAEMEPYVQARAAIFSPDSGIISAHHLMHYYFIKAHHQKVNMAYHTKVVKIERESSRYRLFTQNSRKENFEFLSDVVINAAGLESDTIANMLKVRYDLHYCKGDYWSISGLKAGTIRRLVYPTPEENHKGLGVHLTMDLNGRFKLGPDTTYIDRKEDYVVRADKAEIFYQNAKKILPFLQKENICPDMSGIRPKLQGPYDDFRDFVIEEDFSGFINLVGIESPGLTASPAIARYVKERHLGG